MSWISRVRNALAYVTTRTGETTDNLWHKCKGCGTMVFVKELQDNQYVCTHCDHHDRIGPTLREVDGLAMSSRNVYLSSDDRAQAVALYRGLSAAQAAWQAGETSAAVLRSLVATEIAKTDGAIDYISIADTDTLEELETVPEEGAVVSLAVRYGTTRLIDNLILPPRP